MGARQGRDRTVDRAAYSRPTRTADGSWCFTNIARVEPGDVIGEVAFEAMTYPVRCHCSKVYDLATVTVTGRYSDCSMWTAPCCGRLADDRNKAGWSVADYTVLTKP